MAFTECFSMSEIRQRLDDEFGNRLRWQMDAAEYEDRMQYATERVFEIINRPFREDDLTDQELVIADQEYRKNIQKAKVS